MFKIAVLVSGSGSNLQSIIDNDGYNKMYEIEYVIADRECYGIERAKKNNIKTKVFYRKKCGTNISNEIHKFLGEKVDLVVLAGFLSILEGEFIDKRKEKVINIHPSLLPKFGGSGMYGINVHKAVIENKEKESGCTVHFVNNGVDTGKIIRQERVEVLTEDTPESLQQRVLIEEHRVLPEVIKSLSSYN